MKAVCLLLCVVLARQAAGHIFKRTNQDEIAKFIVQPLDYINQQGQVQSEEQRAALLAKQKYMNRYQQQSQEQRSQESQEQQKHRDQRQHRQQKYQTQSQERYQQSREQNDQQRQQSNEQRYQSQEQIQNRHKHSQESQSQSQEQRYQSQEQKYQSQEQKYQSQEQKYQSQEQKYQSQEQRYQQSQQQQRKQQRTRAHDSTSVESNSQETSGIYENSMPVYGDANTAYTRSLRKDNQMKPIYGKSITWRDVKIASGSKYPVQKEDIQKIFTDAYNTMKHVSEEEKKIFHRAVEQALMAPKQDAHLDTAQMLEKNDYPVETHTIKTDDGYYLTLFRITSKKATLVEKPVVFLMHGLLGSSDDWLLLGPGKALAYLLADAGYEVWLGNARGNRYSRRHVSKHSAQADYWQFSTDEIALVDLPNMIDYVLKTSNQEKLTYVGQSQGTTAFFALASTRPEYNDKIIMMYALSPMVYMSNTRSPLLRMIAPTSQFSELLHEQLGHGEFKPSKQLVKTVGGSMLEAEIGCKNVSSNVNFVMSGVNVDNLKVDLIPVIMAHLPAGASTRQMKQYAQAVASHQFTKYDFGAEMNAKVYGSRQAPKYDMKKVKTPVALYYSEEDWLAAPRDVERLEKELPIVKDSYKVPEKHFSHMDFQFSKNAPEVVYSRLIQSINKQNKNQQNSVY